MTRREPLPPAEEAERVGKQPQQIPRPRLSGGPESYALYRDEVVDSVSAAAVGALEAIFAIAS